MVPGYAPTCSGHTHAVLPLDSALSLFCHFFVLQARETLKLALQTQIQQKQAALDHLKQQAAEAKAKLLAITQQLAAVGSDVAESVPRQQQQAAAPMAEG